jgi:hypothetical protein
MVGPPGIMTPVSPWQMVVVLAINFLWQFVEGRRHRRLVCCQPHGRASNAPRRCAVPILHPKYLLLAVLAVVVHDLWERWRDHQRPM